MAKELPERLRLLHFEEADFQCARCCYREGLDLTVHQIVFREDDGPTGAGNLILICHNCHSGVRCGLEPLDSDSHTRCIIQSCSA